MKKYVLSFVMIFTLMGMMTSALAWESRVLPRGNYIHTCRLCVMSGHTLSCRCKNEQGFGVDATAYITNRCDFVENYNGQLKCSSYLLPRGSYKKTCNACRMIGNSLSCNCKNNAGYYDRTTKYISARCRNVRNINGGLVCDRYRYPHHHPKLIDFNAGPIWNEHNAKIKCPVVCSSHRGHWTGRWNTVSSDSNSVCQCRVWRQYDR